MMTLLAQLFRPRLAFFNGVTALGGYCLFQAPFDTVSLLAAFWGVTLLAMGSSALNQLLERDIDLLMVRTMCRPLPQGRLSGSAVFLIGSITVLAGLLILAAAGTVLATLGGAAAVVWYLAVYTPLKRRTSFALPFGAICGAFPPLIGWCLAGGSPDDSRIAVLAGMFFLWQIPHFWLLQVRHADDYRRAGIPLIDARRCTRGPISVFFVWVTALAVATILLSLLGGMSRNLSPLFLIVALILPLLTMQRFERLLFPVFSLFPLAMTALLMLQRLI